MVTLKDIAAKAGLNVSTVSKALRGSSDISTETKLKVMDIAKQMNYPLKPRKGKQSESFAGLIGVICPEIKSNYYSHIVSVIEDEIKKQGYFFIMGFTNFDYEMEKYHLEHMKSLDVSGIIFISESDELESALSDYKSSTTKPLILVAQNTETKEFDCIKIDDDYGVKMAVEHLITSGHKDICFLGDEFTNSRMNIFLNVMNENEIEINKKWVQMSNERFEKCGYDLMNNILKCGDLPTAVLGAYDDIAIGALKAIYDKGLKVPDDISVIGIDNIRYSSYCVPELTTIAGPVEEMGKIAANLLLKKIDNKQYDVVQNIRLSPRFIERKSVKIHSDKEKVSKIYR